jgi:hypothetical protein
MAIATALIGVCVFNEACIQKIKQSLDGLVVAVVKASPVKPGNGKKAIRFREMPDH